jgi:hypothetical protein
MAATLAQIADGLETRLATITGLRVFDHIPDVFAPPCAFVMPENVQYWQGFAGGNAEHAYTVTVIVGRTSERASQKTLYAFMNYSGDTSIRAAIEADRTLGGVVQTLLVERSDNVRMISQGEADYLAADFSVRVHA